MKIKYEERRSESVCGAAQCCYIREIRQSDVAGCLSRLIRSL